MKNLFSQVVRGTLFVSFFSTVHAGELEIKPTFEATFGAFSSGKSYNGENLDDERINWQEGDILINRRHFVLHPRGIKWAGDTGIAPNNAGLATAANWERVYDPKQIRIVAFKHKIK